MADRDDIVEWTNDYLKLHDYHDYGPMGLQFTGAERVTKIATAVSVCYEVIEMAADADCDMLLTHHGLWWNNESHILDQRTAGRIALARENNMSILGYHLCLDAHPEIGNNILLAQELNLHNLVSFGEIGWGGERSTSRVLDDASSYLMYHFGPSGYSTYPDARIFDYGPDKIERVAVIAGGAPQYLSQAHKEGYDLFVTGEAAEFTRYQAQELNMHFVAAGHHRTEKSGIYELGKRLADEFSVEHLFYDIDNPI